MKYCGATNIIVASLFWLITTATANELSQFLRRAAENHPVLEEARSVVEMRYQEHKQLLEALDPQLLAAAGYATQQRDLPLVVDGYRHPKRDNSLEAEAGVMVPVEQGAYLSVGAVARRWFEPDDGYDPMYQHLVGVNLTVPLWRDRGFAMLGWRRQQALAAWNGAVHRLAGAEKDIRHQVEQAYVNACEAFAAYQVTREATARFERLNKEAQELARLRSVPDYQVQETQRDLQLGREDEEVARNNYAVRLAELTATLGDHIAVEKLQCTLENFMTAAAEQPAAPAADFQVACQNRSQILALQADKGGAEAEHRRLLEESKDDLSLHVGASWQGDGDGMPTSAYRKSTSHNWGGGIAISWSRPLNYTGNQAQLAAQQSRIDQVEAQIRHQKVQLHAQLRTAQLQYSSAMARLAIIRSGVEAARKTVTAEQERFRLGEGSSGDVLDAQKNLTALLQRLVTASAAVLRARSDLEYALGYPVEKP